MDRINYPELLPRPDYSKTYRQPLEAFVDGSIVIIVGDKQNRITGRPVDLYTNCRIFTAITDRPGTKKQKQIFQERPILDHLWIPEACSKWNVSIGMPNLFAVGKIEWYTRKNGSKDLTLVPIDENTHLECLFVGTIFIYGLHLLEEARKLIDKSIVAKSFTNWTNTLDWLKMVTDKFKETITKKKIKLEKPDMIKYIDKFLLQISKEIEKCKAHISKLSNKKGFGKTQLIYI